MKKENIEGFEWSNDFELKDAYQLIARLYIMLDANMDYTIGVNETVQLLNERIGKLERTLKNKR